LAVYRNDQVDFSFASEVALGGYFAPLEATLEASSGFSGALSASVAAGSRTISVDGDNMDDLTAGTTYVIIGNDADTHAGADDVTLNSEIRRIVSFTGAGTSAGVITLSAPLGYPHLDNCTVKEADTDSGVIQGLGISEDSDGDVTMDHIRFTPGVWETIELPDPAMEIEPRYFLGTESKRNFYTAFKGQQSFSGTLSNFELLNGYPLRFPIGKVASKGSTPGSDVGTSTAAEAVSAGDYFVLLVDASNYADDEYIQIEADGSGKEEIRKITQIDLNTESTTQDRIWVDYPFLIAHDASVACKQVVAPFTHYVTETVALSPVTWQVRNRDSSETATNDWLRRYIGGKIGQATLTAEEGGTLRMSWDSAPFIDIQHNQYDSSAVTAPNNKYDAGLSAVTVEYPGTEPYYFSQGSIQLFGVTFARVTNFTININNNLEPRYFIRNDGSERTPSEIYEGRREYSMTATVVLPDSAAGATDTTRTLFKELLTEGDYGSGTAGFDIDLVFTRGTSDTITINVPANQDGASGTGGNNQGAFIRSANTSVSTDNPVSTEVDVLFRNMSATIVDSEPVYP
jgi:hypothetical protein